MDEWMEAWDVRFSKRTYVCMHAFMYAGISISMHVCNVGM